jgi:2-desacetyl-2-hydroxyethyl bacteriochlorophyllide A dehydrogenase
VTEYAGRRIAFTGPGRIEWESFAVTDDDLAPTELLVRTRTTVISPGTELAWLAGKTLDFGDDGPYVTIRPGYANIGIVLAAGSAVPARPGDRVYSMAPHATVARIDMGDRLCVPVPDGLADEEAVFARLATVSMTTLLTTSARGGDAVAVVGLGLVGNLAAQVFRRCGMAVSAIDRATPRRAIAERCGLRDVYESADDEQLRQRHRLVIEASGSAVALASAVGLAASGGEIVMIGAPWGGAANSVPSGRLTGEIFTRFLRLRSGSEWAIPRQPQPPIHGSIQGNSAVALDWLARGELRAGPLITHRLPATQAATAYEGLRTRPADYLGVVLDWGTAD